MATQQFREETFTIPTTGTAGSASGSASWALGPFGGTAHVIECYVHYNAGQPGTVNIKLVDHINNRVLNGTGAGTVAGTGTTGNTDGLITVGPGTTGDYASESLDINVSGANPDTKAVTVSVVIQL